ncbi:MAG: hypothetical protein Q4B96_01445 [Bacillota bacterium]|nr:hypothetical protein [Bacillota bacterium]
MSDEKKEVKLEDYFDYTGEQGYYGRKCANYDDKCAECKWNEPARCREGHLRG